MWAEREVAPNHRYRFEVSADWKQIGRFWMSPVDVAGADAVKDASVSSIQNSSGLPGLLVMGGCGTVTAT